MTNPSVPFIAQTFKAGEKLAGCYTLKETLPSQGFCFVWLAHDEELNKEIVLHFVPDFVAADARAMTELKQEAKRNRQLIHPRIIRVHDLVTDEKWAAISMDHVPGETLAVWQRKHEKNACNPSEITAGISELWQTLEDAHRIDLFHRDLTPENIVATGNGFMIQKFGISRVILDSLARGGQQIEASRDVAYLSPQQLDGERPSRSDDIYSLGASIFDLLTGVPPFNEGDVIPQIRKSVPPLVSERRAALGIAGEPAPKAWDEAIAACLAKNVEDRPKSAAEAGARFAAGKPGAAASAPLVAAAAGAAAIATGTAAAAAGTAPQPPPETQEPPKAAPPAPPELESATKQQKRPWTPGPGKTPVIAEATILSKTPVPKDGKGETSKEPAPSQPAEPAAAAAAGTAPKKGGPTTPTGFPLRAFVGVEGEPKPRGKSSAGLVALVVVVLLILIIGYIVARNGGSNGQPENSVAATGTNGESSSASSSESTNPPTPVQAASPAPAPVNLASTSPASSPAAVAVPSAPPSTPAPAAGSPAPAAEIAPTPTPIPAAVLASMTDAQAEQLVAEKTKAVDQAKAALADAQKAAQEKAAAQTQAAAAVQELQASIKQKAAAAAAARKAADDAAAALKQQQDALQKAQADADAAEKAAAAKAQAADQTRKAVQEAQAAVQQQQSAQQQAQADADQLAKAVADRQQAADAAAKAAADAATASQEQAQALSQAEAALNQAQAGITQARTAEKARLAAEQADSIRKAREAAAAQAKAQVAAAAKAAADAQAALAAAQKAVADAQRAQAEAERQAAAASSGTLPALSPAPSQEASPAATPSGAATPASGAAILPAGAPGPMPGAAASPAPKQGSPTLSVGAPNPHLKVDQALSNSLGMRFAPVGHVFFSIWLTRVQDFAAFATATGFKGTGWQDPGFKQAPDHPVVNVSWNDANQFCLWLTEKEHHEGILAANQTYRLPTDLEWSAAVGLRSEAGRTPESRDMDVPDVYPWGTEWPPPPGAGNYTGEETDSDVAIKGYNDGFAWTSPVGSFNANKFGLYDMGGNVWEWCEDWWNSEQKAKVLRGGSWYNGALKLSLLSSCRIHASADQGTDNYGFRVVIAEEMKKEKPKHRTQ